jgi:hypothetical protein
MEIWKPVAGFSTYQVSSLGRVRRIAGGRWGKPGAILKNGDRGKGYLRVMLRDNGRAKTVFVHHLVAEAFHGPRPSPIHEAAHGDGDKANNTADNISWLLRKANHAQKHEHGTMACGERQGSAKLTAEAVRTIRSTSTSARELAALLSVSPSLVRKIRNGEGWRHVA